MEKVLPRQMTDVELKSMLKSSVQFKSLGGVRCKELTLSPEEKRWFSNCKIGMFVHWGLYSVLGHGEWAKYNEQIPDEEYKNLENQFSCETFSPEEWVRIAKDFGAKYMIMVTRHHDGYSLWDSKGSYDSFTSFKGRTHRDYVKEYVNACKKHGMRIGLYYSLMDWRFPGYFDPKGLPDNAALLKKQAYLQVEELCRDYEPDILWYDGAWLAHKGSDTSSAWFWEPEKLNLLARSYNPKLLINPRSGWEGDFYCDEGSHEIKGKIIPVLWEKNMCICSGCSWGWMENDPVSDYNWLIQMLVNVVCRGGNWLVNIAPDKRGKISVEIRERIHQIGQWLRKYGESIYETSAGPYEPEDGIYGSTYRDNTVYLHILDLEKFRQIRLPQLEYEIVSASLLEGEGVQVIKESQGVRLLIPKIKTQPDIVVKLKMDKSIRGIENEYNSN